MLSDIDRKNREYFSEQLAIILKNPKLSEGDRCNIAGRAHHNRNLRINKGCKPSAASLDTLNEAINEADHLVRAIDKEKANYDSYMLKMALGMQDAIGNDKSDVIFKAANDLFARKRKMGVNPKFASKYAKDYASVELKRETDIIYYNQLIDANVLTCQKTLLLYNEIWRAIKNQTHLNFNQKLTKTTPKNAFHSAIKIVDEFYDRKTAEREREKATYERINRQVKEPQKTVDEKRAEPQFVTDYKNAEKAESVVDVKVKKDKRTEWISASWILVVTLALIALYVGVMTITGLNLPMRIIQYLIGIVGASGLIIFPVINHKAKWFKKFILLSTILIVISITFILILI